MKFIFTDDCSIGIAKLDSEHRYLFSLMNKIIETIDSAESEENIASALPEYVGLLIEYGKIHFAHEEQYMEEIHDVELERQKKEHSMFMDRLCSINLCDLTDVEKKAVLDDTLKYMTKWLYSHVIGSDTLIGKVRHIADELATSKDMGLFNSKYYTGVKEIDDEHQVLFKIFKETLTILEDDSLNNDVIMKKTDKLYRQLEECTIVHFKHEEEYMKEIGYPYLDDQKRAHAYFVDRMKEAENDGELGSRQYMEDLLVFLFAWLGNHIIRMDKVIGNYIKPQ